MDTSLDLRSLMSALHNAPDLDLLQLRTAIDHLLQNPQRLLAIRQRLHTGQEIAFWSTRDRRMHRGRVVQFKPEHVLIRLEEPGAQHFWVDYAAIHLNAAEHAPATPPRPGLNRSDFAVGDAVSFEGRDLIAHVGTIVRLNAKTATVACQCCLSRYLVIHRRVCAGVFHRRAA